MDEPLYLIKAWGRDCAGWVPMPYPDFERRNEDGTVNYWWVSKAARDRVLDECRSTPGQIICTVTADGILANHRCVARFTAEYQGKQYEYEHDMGYGYGTENAEFMFHEGNYACDDNRSGFIRDKYPDFPKIEQCGNDIKHVREEFALVRDDPRDGEWD